MALQHTCKVSLCLCSCFPTQTDKHLQKDARNLLICSHLFAVFRVGEVNEVVIVHLLRVDDVAVLLLAQVLGVDAIGSQELLVSDAERLADGLSDKLGLRTERAANHDINMCLFHP